MPDTNAPQATYQTLGINSIREPEWNSRIAKKGDEGKEDQRSLKALADDIKERGVQTPIEVEGPDDNGAYLLVYGSRRLAASKLAGLHEIPALVRPSSSQQMRMVRNAAENLQRRDLTSFETARVIGSLRQTGMSLKEIQAHTGMAVSTASNYNAMWENLAEPIKAEWAKGVKAARVDFLRQLATVDDHTVQLERFDAEQRRIEAAEEKGESTDTRGREKRGDSGSGSTAGVRFNTHNLNFLLDFSKSGRTPSVIGDGRATVTKEWLRGLMDWLCGQSQTAPPGLLDHLKAKPAPAEKPGKAPPAKGAKPKAKGK